MGKKKGAKFSTRKSDTNRKRSESRKFARKLKVMPKAEREKVITEKYGQPLNSHQLRQLRTTTSANVNISKKKQRKAGKNLRHTTAWKEGLGGDVGKLLGAKRMKAKAAARSISKATADLEDSEPAGAEMDTS